MIYTLDQRVGGLIAFLTFNHRQQLITTSINLSFPHIAACKSCSPSVLPNHYQTDNIESSSWKWD